jgi:phosphoenolpyruvate phosphomutase
MQASVQLRELFAQPKVIRLIGAHNALGAKLAERCGFDGVWSSGLEISTSHGVPDADILTMSEYLEAAERMADAVSIPVVADCDTGFGNSNNVINMVRRFEAAGVAAVCIEDKMFPKVNSFIPGRQELAPIAEFVGKIMAAKNAQRDPAFMVIARVEALIAGWGMDEAVKRAEAYRQAGCDAILIHSKSKTPDEIQAFLEIWQGRLPVVIVPTTYYNVPIAAWEKAGARMVIYANHGLRSAIRSMTETYRSILETGSTAAIENQIAPLKEVFELQGMHRMKEDEERFLRTGDDKVVALIPAAGDHMNEHSMQEIAAEIPIAMIDVNGKSLLERQMNALARSGIYDVHVIGGYKRDKIKVDGIKLHENAAWRDTGELQSILCAGLTGSDRVLVAYSDILFDASAVAKLLRSDKDITLLVDSSYQPGHHKPGRKVDLVITERPRSATRRALDLEEPVRVQNIGLQLNHELANAEYAGLALFSREGWKAMLEKVSALSRNGAGAFHEAASFRKAALTDMLQDLIDEGLAVHAVEVSSGWIELHSFDDYKQACRMVRNA